MIGGSLLWAKGQTFARSFYRHCLCRMSTWRRVPERPPADSILRASGDMKPSSTSNISSLPSQQTLVFRSDRTRFFRLLSLTATVQAVFWVSAGLLVYYCPYRANKFTLTWNCLLIRDGIFVVIFVCLFQE